MASSPSLLRSTTSSFHAQFTAVPTLHSIRLPKGNPRNRWDGLSVRAASIVLVDQAEATKVHRLKTHYLEKIVPLLKEEFAYANIHEVPKVEKIVVNCGMGQAAQNEKGLDAAIKELASITAQRPMITRAKKAIATFKLREGQPTGIACTLRGKVMYAFLDRMINLGLPRTRDFQGVSPNSFDGQGNYNLGFTEQGVFPEIRSDLVGKQRGMDVCIVTSAKTDKECFRLLALMGMPFREGGGQVNVVRKKKLKAHHFSSKSKAEAARR